MSLSVMDRNIGAVAAPASRGAGRSVLFVLPGLSAGGSEHVVTFLANRLAGAGYAVSIASFEEPGSTPYYSCDPRVGIDYLGVPIGRAGPLRALDNVRQRVARLRALFRSRKPDLVISLLTRTNVISVLAARGLGFPVIVSERNNPDRQRPGRVWDLLRRFTYARAHGLVTMTRGAMDYFPPVMRKRGWVIPNMADWQEYKPRYDNKQKMLTAVGRLTEQKGFDLLLRAFAKVAADHPGWTLRIWGKGPDRAALEALAAQLGIADRVEMPGVSSQPGSWIESADAFVLSSRFEGWGLVLGEAMAAGLPCISFDCPFGPADMITDSVDGLLVPDGDVEAMATGLSRLLGDGELREKLAGNARDAAQRFAPDRIAGLWEQMIDEVFASMADDGKISGIKTRAG